MTDEAEGLKGFWGRLAWALVGFGGIGLALIVWAMLFVNQGPSESSPDVVESPLAPAQSPSVAADSPRFVGSQACVACHAEISQQFAAHPMRLSARPIADDEWLEEQPPLPATIPGKQRVLEISLASGQMIHSEQMFDAQGERIYKQEHPQQLVVGSGRVARAYLERRGDLLFMSPINWYHKSNSWDLAPAYRPDDVRRFDRRVQDECAVCHMGNIDRLGHQPDTFPTASVHELAISCERCHGPASTHVEFQSADASSQRSVSDQIVNPAKLDAERRDAVCFQCHLEAAARIVRRDKSPLDFQAGMKLSDVWLILDQGTQVSDSGRTRSVNHVQQMRDSRCYQGSADNFTCTSCHDPHRVPAVADRADFYREKCLKCHNNQTCTEALPTRQAAQDDCTACHMPSLNSLNMSHVAQTDHRVLRVKEPADAPAPRPANGAGIELKFFGGDALDAIPADEKQRALLLGTAAYCRRKGLPIPSQLPLLLEKHLVASGKDAQVLVQLGELALDKNDLPTAKSYFQQCLALEPKQEVALEGVLEVAYRNSEWSQVVETASAILKIDPTSTRVVAVRGDALKHLGRNEDALADLHRAVELNPGLELLRQWLVTHLRDMGRSEEADREEEVLMRVRGAKVP